MEPRKLLEQIDRQILEVQAKLSLLTFIRYRIDLGANDIPEKVIEEWLEQWGEETGWQPKWVKKKKKKG